MLSSKLFTALNVVTFVLFLALVFFQFSEGQTYSVSLFDILK